ncbi:hypothetical protein GCM10023213_28180 [Prosthecobacter algae]|uniref:Uncharacterized protein n=1 Tax=Prosthecobacter algae TaxID=1144682 RepID=A0ABP9P8F2_9BACT
MKTPCVQGPYPVFIPCAEAAKEDREGTEPHGWERAKFAYVCSTPKRLARHGAMSWLTGLLPESVWTR